MSQHSSDTARVPLWVWGALLLTAAVVGPILATSLGARAVEEATDAPKYAQNQDFTETSPVDENRDLRHVLPEEQYGDEPEPVVPTATAAAFDEPDPLDNASLTDAAETAPEIVAESPAAESPLTGLEDPVADVPPAPRAVSQSMEDATRDRHDPDGDFRPSSRSAPRQREEPVDESGPAPRSSFARDDDGRPVSSETYPSEEDRVPTPRPAVVRPEIHANRTSEVGAPELPPQRTFPTAVPEHVESRFAQLMQTNPAWSRIQMAYTKQGTVPMVQLNWGTCRIRAYRVQIGDNNMVARNRTAANNPIQLIAGEIEPTLDVKLNEHEMHVSLPGVGEVLTSSSVSLKLEALGLHPEQIDAFLSRNEIQVSAGEFNKETPAVIINAGGLQILAADVHLEDLVGPIDITADADGVLVKREDFSLRCTKFKLQGDTLTLSARGQGRIVIEELRDTRSRPAVPASPPLAGRPTEPTRRRPSSLGADEEPESQLSPPAEPEIELRPQLPSAPAAPKVTEEPEPSLTPSEDLNATPVREEEPEAPRPDADLAPPKPEPAPAPRVSPGPFRDD